MGQRTQPRGSGQGILSQITGLGVRAQGLESESQPQAGQAPWGGGKDPEALRVAHLGTGLTVVGRARAHVLCCQVVPLTDHRWGHPQV